MTPAVVAIAYVPFLYPLHFLHGWTYVLLVPLAFGISVIYKALRMTRLDAFWWQVTVMTTQIVLAMIGLAIGLWILVQYVVPLLPVR